MSNILLPVRSDIESYRFVCALEGSNYGFRFRFNRRLGLWVMDVTTPTYVSLVCSVPVQTDVDLIGRFEVPGLPPGGIFAIDETGNHADAGLDDLGNAVKVVYVEAGDA